VSDTTGGGLGVVVDGVPLPAADARALWRRFSDWMNDHAGDLSGFAAAEGFASVRPELHDGVPVLACSRTAPQTPYGPAAKRKSRPVAPSVKNEKSRKRPRGRG